MSKFADKTFNCLKECFPHFSIIKEFYVKVGNNKYFFDFLIKELNILIECHGEQHFKFVQYFHVDMIGFNKYKARDIAKEIFAKENNYILVKFFYSDEKKLTPDYVKEKIYNVINSS